MQPDQPDRRRHRPAEPAGVAQTQTSRTRWRRPRRCSGANRTSPKPKPPRLIAQTIAYRAPPPARPASPRTRIQPSGGQPADSAATVEQHRRPADLDSRRGSQVVRRSITPARHRAWPAQPRWLEPAGSRAQDVQPRPQCEQAAADAKRRSASAGVRNLLVPRRARTGRSGSRRNSGPTVASGQAPRRPPPAQRERGEPDHADRRRPVRLTRPARERRAARRRRIDAEPLRGIGLGEGGQQPQLDQLRTGCTRPAASSPTSPAERPVSRASETSERPRL